VRIRILVCVILVIWALLVLNRFFPHLMEDIMLPKVAHNNTIAQAPIFEYWDDSNANPNGKPTPWCDEMNGSLFTCRVKPHQTFAIADRISMGEYLESCDAAKEAHVIWIEECKVRCDEYYGPDSNSYIEDRNLVYEFHAVCLVDCVKPITLPECGEGLHAVQAEHTLITMPYGAGGRE